MIIVVLLIIIGTVLCIKGVRANSNYENAVSFEELAEDDIKSGTYVCGYINSFVISEIMVNDEPVRDGVSQVLIDFVAESDIYTIPVLPDTYIQLMAREEDTRKGLKIFCDSPQDKVYFKGEIIRFNLEPNEAWYGSVDEDKFPNINNIITDYYIREIDEDELWDSIKLGSLFLILAVAIFIDAGGFKGLIEETETKIEGKRSNGFEYIYNKEDELINKESILRLLTRRQKRLKSKRVSSAVMLGLGVLMSLVIPKLILVGFVLIFFGGKGLWEWFINSSNIHAIKLARKLEIESLYLLIQQCKLEMKELEELIYEEDENI